MNEAKTINDKAGRGAKRRTGHPGWPAGCAAVPLAGRPPLRTTGEGSAIKTVLASRTRHSHGGHIWESKAAKINGAVLAGTPSKLPLRAKPNAKPRTSQNNPPGANA
jgi:hypothetical protein